MLEEGQTAAATEGSLCDKVVHIDMGVRCGFLFPETLKQAHMHGTCAFYFLLFLRLVPLFRLIPLDIIDWHFSFKVQIWYSQLSIEILA